MTNSFMGLWCPCGVSCDSQVIYTGCQMLADLEGYIIYDRFFPLVVRQEILNQLLIPLR